MANKDSGPGLSPVSLGRAGGTRMQRTPSHESLTTHPLLSSSPNLLEHEAQPATRYVPYTPRHRNQHSTSVPTTSASPQPTISISNSTSNPSFQASPTGVTGRLQLQNLKAEAQAIGLSNDSVGWAIIEKLCSSAPFPDAERPEWDEVWDLLTKSQATLLLPAEPMSGNLVINPELLRDHLALCNPLTQAASPVVTASGIRGTLQSSTLTFRSLINTASVNFKSLLSITNRATALASLPPLPVPLVPNPSYPSVRVVGQTLTLPLLARPVQPPPLPARPGTTAPTQQARTANPPAPSAASRLNPFASLFGTSRSTPTPTPLPVANVTPAPPIPLSDTGSPRSSIDAPALEGPIVAAYAIDHRILRASVAKDATRAIKGELKAVLGAQGIPGWVKDRVLTFVNPLLPAPKASRRMSGSSGQKPPSPDMSSPQAASDSIQHFLGVMEDELFSYFGTGNNNSRKQEDLGVDEKAASDRAENEERERKMRGVMEKVEKVVCSLFYDRLFRPSTSDDTSHDDALASQIASLNMLDITLSHLGVEVLGGAEQGVEEVIKSCGQEFQKLNDPSCRSPAEKAAVLVSANRIIAEGLSRLPPLRLKSENEMAEEKTPTMPSFDDPNTTGSSQPTPDAATSTGSNEPTQQPIADPLSTPSSPVVSAHRPPREQHLKSEPLSAAPNLAAQSNETVPSPSPTPSVNIQPTAVSSDVLLPVMIYAVVKTNPNQLVSHLLYVQRFRSRSVGGEESFCLINLMAVVEFLENVDLAALGLASSDKVMSVADLTPIPLAETVESAASASHHPLDIISASVLLRGKVNQVGEMAGSAAGKVLLGVVDTSMLALKGLLSGTDNNPDPSDQRPGFGLLRRGSGFSIASVAASLPAVGRSTPRVVADEIPQEGQQLIEVSSRPGSLNNMYVGDGEEGSGGSSDDSSGSEDNSSDQEGASEDEGARGDTRSVRSFSSMLSRSSKDDRRDRLSLQDRLANMSTLSRFSRSPPGGSLRKPSPPPARRASLLTAGLFVPGPNSSIDPQAPSPSPMTGLGPRLQIPPPNPRFLECTIDDLKVSEVAELLADYRRIAAGMQVLGGFST